VNKCGPVRIGLRLGPSTRRDQNRHATVRVEYGGAEHVGVEFSTSISSLLVHELTRPEPPGAREIQPRFHRHHHCQRGNGLRAQVPAHDHIAGHFPTQILFGGR
jgi:hypothetical protein